MTVGVVRDLLDLEAGASFLEHRVRHVFVKRQFKGAVLAAFDNFTKLPCCVVLELTCGAWTRRTMPASDVAVYLSSRTRRIDLSTLQLRATFFVWREVMGAVSFDDAWGGGGGAPAATVPRSAAHQHWKRPKPRKDPGDRMQEMVLHELKKDAHRAHSAAAKSR